MEESLTLQELEYVVKAQREREHRQNKFLAALKGIDLDDDKEDVQKRFAEIEREAQAELRGVSAEKLEYAEFGVDIVYED